MSLSTLHSNFSRLAIIAACLTLCVIMLGAYTRLKEAGLGCPDWPGCYGQLVVPQSHSAIAKAERLFQVKKVEPNKAWAEMIHRYFAGSLALIIFGLGVWSIKRRLKDPEQPIVIPLLLVGVVIFQAMLGMWTVTWKLLPTVVMGHLLGGMTLAALLWSLALMTNEKLRERFSFPMPSLRIWAVIGLVIVSAQIFLGGWTSSNYAALICRDFPTCKGSLFPHMDFASAFRFVMPIGTNYEGGLLHDAARIAIQMVHRYGALITFLYVAILGVYLTMPKKLEKLRAIGWAMSGLVLVQVVLGILNIETLLKLPVAVAHNGVAALLLLTMVTFVFAVFSKSR